MRIPIKLIVSIIAIVVIAAIAFMLLRGIGTSHVTTTMTTLATTTVAATTTVSQANVANIRNCTTISKSGTYFIASNINTSAQSGACIAITASNVKLVGNLNTLTGNGPYVGLPPFSYGIAVYNASNVTITGVRVLQFSYDVYFANVTSSTITNDNLTKPVMSGIYLSNSHNDNILNNQVSWSNSVQGAIYLQGGVNLVVNNTITNNAYYGIVVNSTGNTFSGDKLFRNTVDLVCNYTSAFRYSNSFSNSTCSLNDYCAFAQCSRNVPFNLSGTRLSPGRVSSCGTISSPGTYSLGASLSAPNFLNTSNSVSQGEPCIKVTAPNVNFACGGMSISGFGYGVYVGSFNDNVSNCVLSNNTYGLYVANSFNAHLRNITSTGSTYGIYFQNSTTGTLTGASLTNDTYGVYMNKTNGITLSSVGARNNTYGIYANSGGTNIFSGGTATNDTKADLYCTAGTYTNSTDDLLQGMSCGVTDCLWAGSCRQHVLPVLSSYPLTSCQPIVAPGNYVVTSNVIAPSSGTCFNIRASNVQLTCTGGYGLTGAFVSGATNGAFSASGVSNVTISGCNTYQFATGVNVSNSRRISLMNLTLGNVRQGVIMRNVSSSTVNGIAVSTYTVSGFNFSKLVSSTVTLDTATTGLNASSGFVFRNATNDIVSFNNAQHSTGNGYMFVNTLGNAIFNNTASQSGVLDYYCSPSSGGLYSDGIGVNFGISKNTCRWLLVVPPISFSPPCAAIVSPQTITLTEDMLYPYGNTCFSAYNTGQHNGERLRDKLQRPHRLFQQGRDFRQHSQLQQT